MHQSVGAGCTSCIAVQSDDRNDSNHRLTSGIRHSSFRVATPAAIVAVYDCRARSPSLSVAPSSAPSRASLLSSRFALSLALLLGPSTLLALSPHHRLAVFLLVSLPPARSSALDPTRYRPHSRVQRRGRDICICIRVHRSLQPPRSSTRAALRSIVALYLRARTLNCNHRGHRSLSFRPSFCSRIPVEPKVVSYLWSPVNCSRVATFSSRCTSAISFRFSRRMQIQHVSRGNR